jgi:hypothetical protein
MPCRILKLLQFSNEVGFAPNVVAADQADVAPLRGRQLEGSDPDACTGEARSCAG